MLSEQLKRLRERHDYTKKYISSILNISPSAYAFYETGQNIPPINAILILANLYSVSLDFLLERKQAELNTSGEFSIVIDVLNDFKKLTPQKQLQFAQYLKTESHSEYAFFSALLEDVQMLSAHQQQQVAEYVRLLKLDNTVHQQTEKKHSKKPRNTIPTIAAFGGGVREMDLQKLNELAAYKKSLENDKKK